MKFFSFVNIYFQAAKERQKLSVDASRVQNNYREL